MESLSIMSENPLERLTTPARASGGGRDPGNQMVHQIEEQEAVQQITKPAATPRRHPSQRYQSQKRRDWNNFQKYLKSHLLGVANFTGAHAVDFLRYQDQFGKTKVHLLTCNFFGSVNPDNTCQCPLRLAWGSLDALIGRLRSAFQEEGGMRESNPFAESVVQLHLRQVREDQSKARGITYEKKKKKDKLPLPQPSPQGYSHGHAQHKQHRHGHKQELQYLEPSQDNDSRESLQITSNALSENQSQQHSQQIHHDDNLVTSDPPTSYTTTSSNILFDFLSKAPY